MTTLLAAASELARQVDRSFWLIGAVTAALLVLITVLMVFFAIRYRRGRSPTASQVHGHAALEIAWIIVPTLIVCWMFAVGVGPFMQERRVPDRAYVIQASARQWAWSFQYPEAGVSSGELVVPVDVPIKIELHSEDVIHGFYVPDLRLKEDVVPGYSNYVWFKADRPGTYVLFCSQYCGKDHSQMHTLLRVLGPGEFDAWLRDQIEKRYRPVTWQAVEDPDDASFAEIGLGPDARKALFNNYCASCHGEKGDGAGLPGQARDFTKLTGWKNGLKVSNVYRTLNEGIAGTQMRPFPNFGPFEKVALAQHVRHFSGGQAPRDTRADFDALVAQYDLDKIHRPPTPLPIDQAIDLLVRRGPATRPQ